VQKLLAGKNGEKVGGKPELITWSPKKNVSSIARSSQKQAQVRSSALARDSPVFLLNIYQIAEISFALFLSV